MARIIVDNLSSQFTYGGGNWSSVAVSHFYGGDATWPDFARGTNSDTGVYGSLTFTFQGTSVAFFGNTPPARDTQWSMFSIDEAKPYNSSFMDPSPASSRQWYQSPTLSDAQHNITITHIPSTSVDYVVITAGENTPLLREVLIVDDSDPSITYSGSWTRNTGMFTTSYDPFIGLPHGNATHQTTSVGASATFSFTGTGVTVAGIFSFDVLGNLAVNYTLDGFSSVENYPVMPTTTEYSQGMKQTENFVLFKNTTLEAGNHTLQMVVTNCVNLVFELDYILYVPSFSTLASMPSLPSISSTSTLSSTASSSSSTVAPSNSHPKRSSTAAIAGGVVGGAVLLLALLLLLCRKRLFRRRSPSPSMRISNTTGPLSLDPFVLSSPLASGTAGFHAPETKSKTDTPTSQTFLQEPSSSTSSNNQFSPATFTPQSSVSGSREDDRLFGRLHRLRKLFDDLHRESAAAGGEEGNNPRVAEVRGRIAELVREESENTRPDAVSVIGSIPPPAYEPT